MGPARVNPGGGLSRWPSRSATSEAENAPKPPHKIVVILTCHHEENQWGGKLPYIRLIRSRVQIKKPLQIKITYIGLNYNKGTLPTKSNRRVIHFHVNASRIKLCTLV